MVRIVWTETATNDIKGIYDFIADDSRRYASITANKIYQKVQVLSKNLHIGRIVPEFNDEAIRELIQGNYRIIYKVISLEEIHIIRIFHSKRYLTRKKLTDNL